ncbi:MAG: DUF3048 domain-containing protein [Patescibacteria group bacterium]|jgi:hypothetical protein
MKFIKELFLRIIAFVKKQPPIWLVVSLLLISVFVVAIGGYFLLSRTSFLDFFSKEKTQQNIEQSEEESLPGFHRLIDGAEMEDETKINPPLFAVQIENMIDARPLSGVARANLVYETLAEAGITRFLAVYAANGEVSEIGPVRSARPYFLDWAEEFGALYVHSGGSPEALRLIPQYDFWDLNEFANGIFFWRSKARYMPHNLYTSTGLLNEAFAAKDGEIKSFTPWQFKDEATEESRPEEEKRIKVYFSTKTYEVGWQYDRESNDYLRYQAGVIQQDRNGEEVRAKNIAVQFTQMVVLDGVGRKDIETTGVGEAIIFQDGVRIDGTWQKETSEDRTKFYDEGGAEIKFNPGVTWVEVVPIGTEIEF